jgi:hypothetical protein
MHKGESVSALGEVGEGNSRPTVTADLNKALERRESVCQPRRSRGADSAALTEGAAEPST